MSNVLLIESCEKKTIEENFSNTSIVHVRNSLILKKELGYELVTHMSQIPKALEKQWDHIVCCYASPYMKYKAYMDIIDNNPNAKLWFLVNDYDLEDNVLLRNVVKKYHKKYNVICNTERSGYRHWILGKKLEEKKLNDWIDEWHVANLNSLIFNYSNPLDQDALKNKKDCIYFGTPRKHRYKDMAAFNGIENYYISSSVKNQLKYTNAGIHGDFIDKLNWEIGNETLAQYKYSIYFEDAHTHDVYSGLANRFYECLMCDVVLFFDAKCQKTINKAREHGYKINDFLIVRDSNDINQRMRQMDCNKELYTEVLNQQRENIDVALVDKAICLNEINSALS
jgi:hypothetical protein